MLQVTRLFRAATHRARSNSAGEDKNTSVTPEEPTNRDSSLWISGENRESSLFISGDGGDADMAAGRASSLTQAETGAFLGQEQSYYQEEQAQYQYQQQQQQQQQQHQQQEQPGGLVPAVAPTPPQTGAYAAGGQDGELVSSPGAPQPGVAGSDFGAEMPRDNGGQSLLSLSQFEIGDPLGTGSFGTVHHCTHTPTNAHCVMKIMTKAKGPFQRSYWEREAVSLSRLSAAVVAGAANAPQLFGAFEDDENFYLAMELIPGVDMFSFLETQKKFSVDENKARLIVWQVLAVLANSHVVGVAHRDIKLENILIEADSLRTTVLDFGLAGVAMAWQHSLLSSQHAAALPVMCNDFCGSLDYAAPEVAYKIGPYDAKLADVWSVGIVLFVLIFGITPFSRKQRYRAIRNRLAHPAVLWPNTDQVSPSLIDLIDGMLQVDAGRRLSLQQVVEHPWFNTPVTLDSAGVAAAEAAAAAVEDGGGNEGLMSPAIAAIAAEDTGALSMMRNSSHGALEGLRNSVARSSGMADAI